MEHDLKYEEKDDGTVIIESFGLPLLDNDVSIRFNSAQEVRDFLEEERLAWQWLRDNGHYRALGIHYFSKIDKYVLQPLSQIIDAWEKHDIERLKSTQILLVNYLEKVDFPFHSRTLYQLVNDQPKEIALSLVYLLLCGKMHNPVGLSVSELKQIQAQPRSDVYEQFELIEPYRLKATMILGDFHKFGLVGNEDYISNRISEINAIRQEAHVCFEKLSDYSREVKDSFDAWISDTHRQIQDKQETEELRADKFARRIARDMLRKNANFRADIIDAYETSKNIVKQAKDTYLSQVELDASVQYWKTKGATHKRSKNSWMGGLFALVAMIAVTPYLLHGSFSNTDAAGSPEGASGVADMAVNASGTAVGVLNSLGTNPLELVSTILAISAISYLIKFFAKQYSTQHHLYLEAEERKVMLMTYLALMNENKLKEQEDRKIALDTLFRPAQTGIFNEASHNVVPSDTIVKIFERQSSKPN